MFKLHLLLLGIILLSCEQNKNRASQISAGRPKLTYFSSGPDPAVFDLLPINGDTLIAVKWHGGLALTTDAGGHWQSMHDQPRKSDFLYIKYLTIDNHHVLWGLDSWLGVHESPYSRLAYSIDFGKTWKRQKFNIQKFFPYTIYSHPKQPLEIVTYDGKIYQLEDRINMSWKFIKLVAELDNTVNDTVYGDSYFNSARFKFLEAGQLFLKKNKSWESIAKTSFGSGIDDVCPCTNATYLIGYNGAVSPTPHYLFKIVAGQIRDAIILPNENQKYLRCDNQGRLWLFNYEGIWKKSGHKLLKCY